MKVINFFHLKGGVGKTTTCHNLAYHFASLGYRVCIVDLDQQASITKSCINTEGKNYKTILDVIDGEDIRNIVLEIDENVCLIPSDLRLALAEILFMDNPKKNPNIKKFNLKKSLSSLSNWFDYILLDCPPQLTQMTIQSLYASDYLVVPSEANFLSYESLKLIDMAIDLINERRDDEEELRPHITISRYNRRLIDSKNIFNLIEEEYDILGHTSESVRVKEALYEFLPIIIAYPEHKVSYQFKEIGNNLLERMNKHE